jgi:hypothetical protein
VVLTVLLVLAGRAIATLTPSAGDPLGVCCGSAVRGRLLPDTPSDTPPAPGSAHARSTAVTYRAEPGDMTASLYVTGTHVASVEPDLRRDTARIGLLDGQLAHAVARPAVDGLEGSVCGLLVRAAAGLDWHDLGSAPRCAECERIAG